MSRRSNNDRLLTAPRPSTSPHFRGRTSATSVPRWRPRMRRPPWTRRCAASTGAAWAGLEPFRVVPGRGLLGCSSGVFLMFGVKNRRPLGRKRCTVAFTWIWESTERCFVRKGLAVKLSLVYVECMFMSGRIWFPQTVRQSGNGLLTITPASTGRAQASSGFITFSKTAS